MKKNRIVSGKIKAYLSWPLIVGVIFIILNLYIFLLDKKIALIVLCFLIVYYVLSGVIYYFNDEDLAQEIASFADRYAETQRGFINELEIPHVLVKLDGRILIGNQAFQDLIHVNKLKAKHIMNYISDITPDKFPNVDNRMLEYHIEYEEKYYKVNCKRILFTKNISHNEQEKSKPIEAVAIYMFDETVIKKYIKQNNEQKLIVALIYIDNYEETIDSVEEIRQPLLIALIERKIDKFAISIEGIIKKLEKDKFILMFQAKHIEEIKHNKFSILEEIRAVNIGNGMIATLSMGLGVNADTVAKSYEYARSAIDLALGRGGDQAVIKDEEKIYYYGGKTTIVDKHTRVKARVKAHALKEIVETKDEVIIMGHKIADMDSLGAAIGIYRIVSTLHKKAHVIINDVTTSVKPLLDMFLNDEAYGSDTFINSKRALEIAQKNTLIVVVDTNRPSYTDCPELLKLGLSTVVLDHHRTGSEVIDGTALSYLEPYASSVCEMVAEIQQYIADKLKLRPLEADAMFAGLSVDTNNFMTKTGVRTFEAAAYLRKSGADMVRVHKLFRNDLCSYQTRAHTIRDAEVFANCMAISICPSENVASPTIVAAQAANELLNIAGIKAAFVLTCYKDAIFISARSLDDFNVQIIMERLGGGGHMNVAGAQMKDLSIEEAKAKVKELAEKMVEEGEI